MFFSFQPKTYSLSKISNFNILTWLFKIVPLFCEPDSGLAWSKSDSVYFENVSSYLKTKHHQHLPITNQLCPATNFSLTFFRFNLFGTGNFIILFLFFHNELAHLKKVLWVFFIIWQNNILSIKKNFNVF